MPGARRTITSLMGIAVLPMTVRVSKLCCVLSVLPGILARRTAFGRAGATP